MSIQLLLVYYFLRFLLISIFIIYTITTSLLLLCRAADWLANQGVLGDLTFKANDQLPSALVQILREDAQGVALSRRVLA